eukprot:9327887-Pyramimonas_sp.AAC.1
MADLALASLAFPRALAGYRPCPQCEDTRAVGCPNCDGQGQYVAYGRKVVCNACKGSGRVVCRSCFDKLGIDPFDLEAIRKFVRQRPD